MLLPHGLLLFPAANLGVHFHGSDLFSAPSFRVGRQIGNGTLSGIRQWAATHEMRQVIGDEEIAINYPYARNGFYDGLLDMQYAISENIMIMSAIVSKICKEIHLKISKEIHLKISKEIHLEKKCISPRFSSTIITYFQMEFTLCYRTTKYIV